MTIEARIRADVESRIRSGEWRPGHRIPFEQELAAEYGCARATVGKALGVLVTAGLIERRRRAGTFVARQHVQSAALAIPDIGAIITARGETYRFKMTRRRIRPPDPTVEAEARLGASGQLLLVTGLHMEGLTPFCAEERLICLTSVPDAVNVDFSCLAPGRWLLEHVPWTQARHRISALQAGRQWAKPLAVPPTKACLSLERWTSRQGKPVTFVRQIFPGNRYDLVAEFEPVE